MESSAASFGAHYLLSTMLGVTNGRGNTVPEILSYLKSSSQVDGTMPKGTIYFAQNSDIRTTTRKPGFDIVIDSLKKLGVNAELLTDELPQNRNDVQGLVAELGDASYSKREQAEKRLKDLGRLAIPSLKEALKNKDLEVVMRAERLLLGQKEQLGADQ